MCRRHGRSSGKTIPATDSTGILSQPRRPGSRTRATQLSTYGYDAHGNALGFDAAAAATAFLYSGEQTDASGLQYLRARYYNPATGRFNRLDPFAGNPHDPQSLHKYLYCHADPVNAIDPSGLFGTFLADLGTAIHKEISALYAKAHPGKVTYGCQIPGVAGKIQPDIMDYSLGQIGEIKPLSASGAVSGELKVRAACAIANGIEFTYNGYKIGVSKVPHKGPQADWIPSTWQPGFQVVWPGRQSPLFASYVAVTIANVDGVIYYHRVRLPTSAAIGLAAAYAVEQYAVAIGERVAESLRSHIRPGFDYATELLYQYRIEAALAGGCAIGVGAFGGALVGAVDALSLRLYTMLCGSAAGALQPP